jgi:peptidoglycan hydrolase-like protein with peptidoglycan-binding domain
MTRRIDLLGFVLCFIALILTTLDLAFAKDISVCQTQGRLKELGYNPGPLDCTWGNKTEAAVKKFQEDNSLPITGKLDKVTKEKLALVPAFDTNVPADVRKTVTDFLEAYNRGDKAAYSYIHTKREGFGIINAFASGTVPIINPNISVSDFNTFKVNYKVPHPAHIISAVLKGGENVEPIRNSLRALLESTDLVEMTETWYIIRGKDGVKIEYYANRGILRFAELLGKGIHDYATDPEYRQFADQPFSEESPLTVRVAMLLMGSVDLGVEQGETLEKLIEQEEILEKLFPPIPMKKISQDAYTFEVPHTWEEIPAPAGKDIEGVVYGGRTQAGSELAVGVKKEFEPSTKFPDGEGTSFLDEYLLSEYIKILDKWLALSNVIEEGDSRVGGVPAKFFLGIVKNSYKGKELQLRLLQYLFAKNQVVYSMTFSCEDQDCDANYDLIMKIKDSFKFR